MMAVFRFQQRCKSLLKTGSDEDVDADGDPLELAFSRGECGCRVCRSGALEENENNLPDVLDKSVMHPHNRQFSTEGCPSG